MPSFIKSLLISAVAVSAAPSIFRRDAQTISQDLKWVNGNLTAVTDATNKWQGGLIKAIPLATAESHLEDSIRGASKGAEASDQISSDNTKQIIDYINNKLTPNIGVVLTALSNKKPQFEKVKLAGVISDDVAELQKLTDALGKTLISKASNDQKDTGKQALAKIDGEFGKATSTWGQGDASKAGANPAASAAAGGGAQ